MIVAPPRRDDVIAHALADEVVITRPDGSTYHLNRTARAVWERCDGSRSTLEIAGHLSTAYEVAFAEALNDVEELIIWLAEADLLQDWGDP